MTTKTPHPLMSPLARARGYGAAHEGTHHFIVQRLTAVALLPLLLWLVWGIVTHVGADYRTFVYWIKSFPVALGLILTLIAGLWHAALGLSVVVEDYVHMPLRRLALLALVRFACFAVGAAGVLAILKIAFLR